MCRTSFDEEAVVIGDAVLDRLLSLVAPPLPCGEVSFDEADPLSPSSAAPPGLLAPRTPSMVGCDEVHAKQVMQTLGLTVIPPAASVVDFSTIARKSSTMRKGGVVGFAPATPCDTTTSPSSSPCVTPSHLSNGSPYTVSECTSTTSLELVSLLGEGGQGSVWEAIDDAQQPVALKFILPRENSPHSATDLAREFRMLTGLPSHPNIVPVLGANVVSVPTLVPSPGAAAGEGPAGSPTSPLPRSASQGTHDVTFIVMELCVPLEHMFQQFRTRIGGGWRLCLPERLAALVARDALAALAHLDRHHMVHGDIKPHNLLATLSEDGEARIRVSDFGLARVHQQGHHHHHHHHHRHHATSEEEEEVFSVRGTLRYMAPEHAMGQATHKSDVWSLGCTIMQLLTGLQPWSELSEGVQVAYALRGGQVGPRLHRAVGPEAEDFLQRCLALSAEERASASELLEHPFVRGVQHRMVEESVRPLTRYEITNSASAVSRLQPDGRTATSSPVPSRLALGRNTASVSLSSCSMGSSSAAASITSSSSSSCSSPPDSLLGNAEGGITSSTLGASPSPARLDDAKLASATPERASAATPTPRVGEWVRSLVHKMVSS